MPRSAYGSVRRTGAGRYWPRVRVDGQDVNVAGRGVTFETKGEAEEALVLHRADSIRGTAIDTRRDVPLSDWLDRWVRHHCRGLSGNTLHDYQDVIRNVILREGAGLKGAAVAGLTPWQVRDWLDAITPHASYARRRKALIVLRAAMRAAVEEKIRPDDPTATARVRRVASDTGVRPHYYLYLSEVHSIVQSAYSIKDGLYETDNPGLALEVLGWSGMRPGELKALAPYQVHPDLSSLLVDAAVAEKGEGERGQRRIRKSTKSGTERWVRLPEPVMDRLVDWMDERGLDDDNSPLFPGTDGGLIWGSRLQNAYWRPAVEAAGLAPDRTSPLVGRRQVPILYDLRASFISSLLAAGVLPLDVQGQVGHQDKATTDLYTQIQAAGLEDTVAVAARSETNGTRGDVIDYLYKSVQNGRSTRPKGNGRGTAARRRSAQ